MDLYKELLLKILEGERVEVTFPNLKINPEYIIQIECYTAVVAISAIVANNAMNDKEKIKEIKKTIASLKNYGLNIGVADSWD